MNRPTHVTDDGTWIVPGRVVRRLAPYLRGLRERVRVSDKELSDALFDMATAAEKRRRFEVGPLRDPAGIPSRPLTTGDVAARLGITERTVRRRIAAGRIPAQRGPGGWEIDVADVR